MAWVGGHFAIGLVAAGGVTAAVCAYRRKGWKAVPIAMIVGGLWATLPDVPRLIREDLPGTWAAATLGSRTLTAWFHRFGDVFFLHNYLDTQLANRWGLRGLAMITVSYSLLVTGLFIALDRVRLQLAQARQHLTARAQVIGQAFANHRRDNQRSEPRTPTSRPVKVVAGDFAQRASRALRQAVVTDCSAHGLALATASPLDAGELLTLSTGSNQASIQAVALEVTTGDGRYHVRCKRVAGGDPRTFAKAA